MGIIRTIREIAGAISGDARDDRYGTDKPYPVPKTKPKKRKN